MRFVIADPQLNLSRPVAGFIGAAKNKHIRLKARAEIFKLLVRQPAKQRFRISAKADKASGFQFTAQSSDPGAVGIAVAIGPSLAVALEGERLQFFRHVSG